MIRFVPIAEHGFAFLDTATMRFVEVDASQVFLDPDDLHAAARNADSRVRGGVKWDLMNRLIEMAEIGYAEHRATIDPLGAAP
jgi:hypothetical protein